MIRNPLLEHIPMTVPIEVVGVDVSYIADVVLGRAENDALKEALEESAGATLNVIRGHIIATSGSEDVARAWIEEFLRRVQGRAKILRDGLLGFALRGAGGE